MNKVLKIFGLILSVIILAAASAALYEFFKNDQESVDRERPAMMTDGPKNIPAEKLPAGCVSNPSPAFTHAFTDLAKIEALGILGGVVGGSPGRSYATIKKGEKVPVYNPTDAVLETIVWADRGSGQSEYGFYFRASCEVTYLLDHVEEIADGIKNLRPKEPAKSTATQFGSQPNVSIKAGELLGYTDGTPQARTFDFLLYNKAKPAFHVNPARWDWEQTVYADCPYDYYGEDLKKQHYALLGSPAGEGKILKAKNCGSPSQDVAGTLSGGWFQGDSTTEKGKWVVFGQQFSQVEMAIRENGANKTFALKEFSPKITPDKITPGQGACFQGYENNWAYAKLISDTKLSLATGAGQCPAAFPEAQAEIWER
ncbi:MAG: hypothetical protein WC238_04015 [Parcubacteria group bacterium]|jgi:hypothetical protein